jgi:hypothetical protein
VYYGTDGTYHDWYLQSRVVSLQVRGRYIVSLHNSGGYLFIPTIWVMSIYDTQFRVQKNELPPISCFQACVN